MSVQSELIFGTTVSLARLEDNYEHIIRVGACSVKTVSSMPWGLDICLSFVGQDHHNAWRTVENESMMTYPRWWTHLEEAPPFPRHWYQLNGSAKLRDHQQSKQTEQLRNLEILVLQKCRAIVFATWNLNQQMSDKVMLTSVCVENWSEGMNGLIWFVSASVARIRLVI